MSYLGMIDLESEVEVRLQADASNPAPVLLSAAIGSTHVQFGGPEVPVAPGTVRAISISTGKGGVIRIHVDPATPDSAAQLEVRVNGVIRDVTAVRRETWWSYAVGEAARLVNDGAVSPVEPTSAESRKLPRNS